MTDQIKIIQDISLLYELALSVGTSLDPKENCHRFLRTLISRKSLNFGSIWLNNREADGTPCCDLFYIHPHFREGENHVTCSHYIMQELSVKPYISISSSDVHFGDLLHEKKVGKGAYAIFRLGDLGFLKLFASNRTNGFSEVEMAQLKQVVDKLKISLDGCFAHIRLKEETEQRLVAQKALEENEHKLRRIIDTSLDGVLSANVEGLAIGWNAQAEKMLGYTKEEVIGKPIRDIFIPKRHWHLFDLAFNEYQRTTDQAIVNRRYEIKCIKKDGTEFPAELSISADSNDKNTLFVCFVRDITEQKKSKIEIELARNRMETLITNLQTGILLENSNQQIVLINQAFCNIFGIPVDPEILIGSDCSQAAEQAKHLFKDPDAFIESNNSILKNRILVENEVFEMADGRILERNFNPLYIGKEYEGHLWQYRDITERQNAQQAIRENEEKYRDVLENMDLGLLEVDLEDNILRANNAFCQMLGYSSEELIGHNASETFLPKPSRQIITDRLEERKKGLSSVYEMQMTRKDGIQIWGLISGAPVRNSQGQIIGTIGLQFDLTDRKKLEYELAEAKLVADRSRLAERKFLTHMSHEIRTPINAVIGMTHLLYETQPDETQKDYLNSLRFSADTLLGIIDNVLDLSKIDAGEIEFEYRPFNLEYLLTSLLQTFQFKIEEKELQIKKTFDPAIKNIVIGDPTRTNQILTNLLGNALKFTEKGVVSLHATLLDQSDGQYLIEFRVHDTGIGIRQDKLETIFEYFKQADVQINRKFGGTGLGLTIVKQLIEMQGGSIRVESQLGQGSDFTFTLAFGDTGIAAADQDMLISETDKIGNNNRIKGLHFLIVEDNLVNQKLICKNIQSWESTFKVANNGLEALEKSALECFDVILMDIHMPEMDGFETTIIIRNDPKNPNKNVPIIALTAAALSDDKRRALEAGMNGFLTKPISPKVLQEHIMRSMQEMPSFETASAESDLPALEQKIDLNYLMELSNGDTHFVEDILQIFFTETNLSIQNIEVHLHQKNWEQVFKLIHKMKPTFTILGLNDLHTQVLNIESLHKNNSSDPAQMVFLIESFIKNVSKVLLYLEKTQKNKISK